MAYPDQIPLTGPLSIRNIIDWMWAAEELPHAGVTDKYATYGSLATLNYYSHLNDKTAPFSISDWRGYIINKINCGGGQMHHAIPGDQSFPAVIEVDVSASTGTVCFSFYEVSAWNKFIIKYNGAIVIDTGWRGNATGQAALDAFLASKGLPSETITSQVFWDHVYINKNLADPKLIVEIYSGPSTNYDFFVSCVDTAFLFTFCEWDIFGTFECWIYSDYALDYNLTVYFDTIYYQGSWKSFSSSVIFLAETTELIFDYAGYDTSLGYPGDAYTVITSVSPNPNGAVNIYF